MTLNFEHSLRGSSIRGAHVRALYALFVGALSFLILTATMVFYSIMTPSAYAETSSTANNTTQTITPQASPNPNPPVIVHLGEGFLTAPTIVGGALPTPTNNNNNNNNGDNGNGNNSQVNSGLNSGSNGNGGSSAGGSSAGSSTGDTTTGMSASTATLIMIVFAALAILARRVRKQAC